jgi:hypothetical protein
MPKNIIVIITIIAIALIVLGGVAAYIGLKSQKGVQEEMREEEQPAAVIPEPAEEPVIQPKEPITTELIDTSDWKTYRNEEYGFELKYPRDFFIFKESRSLVVLVPNRYRDNGTETPQIEVNVYSNPFQQELKTWIEINKGRFTGNLETLTEPEEVKVNQYRGLRIKHINMGEFMHTFFSNDSYIVDVSASRWNKEFTQIYNSVLRTLRFK